MLAFYYKYLNILKSEPRIVQFKHLSMYFVIYLEIDLLPAHYSQWQLSFSFS